MQPTRPNAHGHAAGGPASARPMSDENEERGMSRIVDRDLDSLREAIMRMGALAENILARAWTGLKNRDTVLCERIQHDDLEIDQLEIEIDAAVMEILALRSPVAVDLRHVIAIHTMAGDLERVGDLARNLASSGLAARGLEAVAVPPRLSELADGSRRLLRRALDAFADNDSERARRVVADDDVIDELESRVIQELLGAIRREPDAVASHVGLILAARDLERVADHATNIAEDVILVAEARNVKHESKLLGRAAS